MPKKVRLTVEEKGSIVLSCLNGKAGYRETLQKYHINNETLKSG